MTNESPKSPRPEKKYLEQRSLIYDADLHLYVLELRERDGRVQTTLEKVGWAYLFEMRAQNDLYVIAWPEADRPFISEGSGELRA